MKNAILYGKLDKVFLFETNEYQQLTWLRIALFREVGKDFLGNPMLERTGTLLPPPWGGLFGDSPRSLVH